MRGYPSRFVGTVHRSAWKSRELRKFPYVQILPAQLRRNATVPAGSSRVSGLVGSAPVDPTAARPSGGSSRTVYRLSSVVAVFSLERTSAKLVIETLGRR